MSSSPKYSTVDVSPIVSQQLAAERRRKAEERRAQRAAEAERERKERLKHRGNALRVEIAEIAKQLNAFAQTKAGQRVTVDLTAINNQLNQLKDKKLREEDEIAAVTKELKKLNKKLTETITRAEAEQLAVEVEQEQAVLLQLKRQSASGRLLSQKFDPKGLCEVESLLSSMEGALKQRNLSKARSDTVRLRDCYSRHQSLVEQGQNRWNKLQEQAATALANAQERLASLQSDEVIQRWCAAALESLNQRAESVANSLRKEQFTLVHNESKAIFEETEKIAASAEEKQARQDQRDYVAKSIRESLAEAGFWLDESIDSQRNSQCPNSDSIIRAVRLSDRRAITVGVPLEGSLQWAVDGFPMEDVAGSDGHPARACVEAVEQIEAIKSHLSEKHGVETGELIWNGKDPNRPSKAAKRLRRYAPHNSQRTQENR